MYVEKAGNTCLFLNFLEILAMKLDISYKEIWMVAYQSYWGALHRIF
jgi:hypothetical protein